MELGRQTLTLENPASIVQFHSICKVDVNRPRTHSSRFNIKHKRLQIWHTESCHRYLECEELLELLTTTERQKAALGL